MAQTKAPSKTNRSLILPVRVSPAEKALLQERAGGPGKVSAYLRDLGLGGKVPIGTSGRKEAQSTPSPNGPEVQRPDRPNEQRVKQMMARMPRRAAEKVVRSEEERER